MFSCDSIGLHPGKKDKIMVRKLLNREWKEREEKERTRRKRERCNRNRHKNSDRCLYHNIHVAERIRYLFERIRYLSERIRYPLLEASDIL